MKVSVIIPTYNRDKLLPATLDSLMRQDFSKDEYEIVVVDNNSTDKYFSLSCWCWIMGE